MKWIKHEIATRKQEFVLNGTGTEITRPLRVDGCPW
jgi:hypothetical protein